ncbi:MAG: hypothetical protein ACFFAN_06580 [Promethearchaeota archaeon]
MVEYSAYNINGENSNFSSPIISSYDKKLVAWVSSSVRLEQVAFNPQSESSNPLMLYLSQERVRSSNMIITLYLHSNN